MSTGSIKFYSRYHGITVPYRAHSLITIISLWTAAAVGCPPCAMASPALGRMLHLMAGSESHAVPVSYATTRLTKPRESDGLVSYLAAQSNLLSKGVTADNNAAVKLCKLLGPIFCGNESLLGQAYPPYSGNTRWQKAVWAAWHISSRSSAPGRIVTFASFCSGRKAVTARASSLSNRAIALARKFFRHPWAFRHPDQLAAQWISANKLALARIRRACTLKHFYVPLIASSLEINDHRVRSRLLMAVSLNYLPAIRDIADTLNADAALRLKRDEVPSCLRDLLAMHRLARLFSQQGDLMCLNTAWSIDERACRADITALRSGEITAKQLAAYIAEIRRLGSFGSLSEMIDTNARWSLLNFFETCALHPEIRTALTNTIYPFPKHLGFDIWPRQYFINVMRLCNSVYDQQVAALKTPLWRTRMTAIFKIENRRDQLSKSKRRYEQLFGMLCINPVQWAALQAQSRDWRDLDALTLAITAYHLAHEVFPNHLAQLAPKYLPAIPRDPFTGKPFQYTASPIGSTITSAGHFPSGLLGPQRPFSGHAMIVHLGIAHN